MKAYDVIIAGAGPAGIAAALSAARNGADTLLADKAGFVGGMNTGGLLNIWCGSASSELFSTVHEACTIVKGPMDRHIYDPEQLKILYLELLQAAGVDLALHCFITGVDMVGSRIRSIRMVHKGGESLASGRVFVDATGDGDVAAQAGVPYIMGRETDHHMQPASVLVMVGGVDDARAVYPTFGTHPQYESLMKQAIQAGLIREPAGHVICIEGYHPGTAYINMTNVIHVDGTDPASLTAAEIHARLQVPGIIRFLKTNVPGYEGCYPINSSNWIGIRETRHFTGVFTLNENHIQNGTIFDDWAVSNASFGFGNHNPDGSGSDPQNKPYSGKRYTIPYRCFISKNIDNLLLSGRCISGTHMAHSSYRVTPICMAMGQAAGTAAVLSLQCRGKVNEIDVGILQKILISQGVALPGS